ncbi:MAG TPA: homocysteine S-methyltransferase family protein [Candidatus Marinimicrobia bacterium]|nr:homocysteine S-methyltransferase family protein [Candidatus Neomarinimicrobiota bacterium]HRS52260.1 homocysteine S-methyltransferase family protein [Candidatus Neomarinimicrobiota bacterium]HRU91948.1 homocysteine S-methyltransferase family protein [Candidatus Neomarinimicrobiota bacterium]
MSFISAIQQARFLILDGALGTELARRGIAIELPLWSANAILYNPQAIVAIHSDYIRAGADIITTATFRTDSLTFSQVGLSERQAEEATFRAVELAREAIADIHPSRQIWIAGSIAPLADCYEPESAPDFNTALRIHRQKAQWLADAGVDFALLETMNNLSEARAASIAALETGLPVFTSFILDESGALLSGENIWSAMNEIKTLGVSGLGINCTHHSLISNFLEKYEPKLDLPLILYANAGIYSRRNGWRKDPNFTPQNYARIAANWLKSGAKIIGGCCGTTPDFIKALADLRKSPV